ncbi:MAG: hypothetical protein J6I68_16755 [Butyrivibrio sp.]|uniref:hypothetical protein n=1 Tax=Butyrivibrio sp. TaxID=28121 RepID=UPI001B539562|nr:hypothetical protein [Butyrivibrio sp.]MBP3784887.1 hypothetical protein [Butyrivibrio sp.]
MDGFKITKEEQKKVLDSLEKQQATKETVAAKLTDKNSLLQEDWNQKTYNEHKASFMERYYPKWMDNAEATTYKTKLENIEKVDIKSALKGTFEKQEQPAESKWYKTKKNEHKKIADYTREAIQENLPQLHFGLNTVRETNALDKYYKYHKDYFLTRNNQRDIYDKYTSNDKKVVVQDWSKIYEKQMKAHGKFFGALKGTWTGLKQRGAELLSSIKGGKEISCRDEMDQGIRPFFSMTKKVLFWKKQVGLLGTETKAERSDGSEYNKRIMKKYTENKNGGRREVMDELALKLIKFKLTPNMLTNKYLASNMLQMQRYTDMLDAFVFLTRANPNYLDMKSKDHTDPDLAAVIWSRIILLAPIMRHFMENHARFCGYKKESKLSSKANIRKYLNEDELKDGIGTENGYEGFVKETWEAIKAAYNSTTDYMDDAADAKMAAKLSELEDKAIQTRKSKAKVVKVEGKEQKEETEFKFKYDDDGKKAEEMQAIKDKIMANPQVYDIFGSEIDQIFDKINEQMRRLDELAARKVAIEDLALKEKIAGKKDVGLKDIEQVWKDYINKERVRITSETEILNEQLGFYKGTIDFFMNIDLKKKDLKLDIDAKPSVKNVLKYEGLDHIFKLKDAFEYNDLFYKTLDYYDFKKFDEIEGKDGKVIKLEDMQSQYNYTLLKRGIDRTRFVNKLVDGNIQKEINNPQMLNNIERRDKAKENYELYKEKYSNITISMHEIVDTSPEKLAEKYNITKELDVTSEETFKNYFWLEKFKKICDDLEFRKEGPQEYNTLTRDQKIDVRVKGRLIRDYFHKWQGAMDFTMSEAYNYIYDTPDMEGNNQVIEGIDKEYRLTTINKSQKKIQDQIDELKKKDLKEGDPEYDKLHKLEELNKFMLGMAEANNYNAKAIKMLDKSAYDAYKAEITKEIKRNELKAIYNADYDELVKSDLAFSWEREAYLARADKAIEIQEDCLHYVKNKAESLAKLGIKYSSKFKPDEDFISQEFTAIEKERIEQAKKENKYDPDKNYALTNDEKKKYLRNCKDKFTIILNKVKTKYCVDGKLNDEEILKNLRDILPEIEFVDSFIVFNHENFEKETGIVDSAYTAEELEKLGEQELLLSEFKEYVKMLLADYGISYWDDFEFRKRKKIKANMVNSDKQYADKMRDIREEGREFTKKEVEKSKRNAEIKKELAELNDLASKERDAQEKLSLKQMKELYKKGDKRIQKKYFGTFVGYRQRTQYDERIELLEKERKQNIKSLRDMTDDLELVQFYQGGAVDDIIRKNDKKAVKGESDWITLRKAEKKVIVEGELQRQEMPVARNYSEELFRYIKKKAGNLEFMDHEKVEEILTQATKAFFFTLSAGARAEAKMRLRLFKNDRTVMNDYFIWKNNKDSEEVLAERCKVFGQDTYVKKNISKIKNIMEAIAETKASISDMQNPKFLDELKEDLAPKGIDEKQFMFLLRKHTVGFAGKAVTNANAIKAEKNQQDVDKYLNVSTKDEFLIETAKDALDVGTKIDINKVNEDYIVEHFAECYYTANKLLAFQQLYYGEKESFDKLYDTNGQRAIVKKIRTYFDKGHGESYALYYNAVISVANKYGITENGGLNFGLSIDEIDTLRDETKADEHRALKDQVKKNLKEAQAKVTDSIEAMKVAYAETDLAKAIQQKVSGTLVSVAPEDFIQEGDEKKVKVKRDTYGLKEGDTKKSKEFEKFYNEYTGAINQTKILYNTYKEHEQNTEEVTFTISNSYHPQMMFFMAPPKSYATATSKIAGKSVCTSFKNLLADDVTNIAGNLSVVDEKNCVNVVKLVKDLKLDMGKIAEPAANTTPIYEDEYFSKQLKENPDFYVSMVNAMNFCIIFESGNDVLNLNGYERQIDKAYKDGEKDSDIYKQWQEVDIQEKAYSVSKDRIKGYKEKIRDLTDEVESKKTEVMRMKRNKEELQKNKLKIADLTTEIDKLTEQINELTTMNEAEIKVNDHLFDQYDKAVAKLNEMSDGKASQYNPELLRPQKLEALQQLKNMFSDQKTRFMVSTYFDLFNAYLLKNGIKIDGSLVNANIYDETLNELTRSDKAKDNMTRNDALDFGSEISKKNKASNTEYFEQKKKYISSGDYLKEYKALENKQKVLDKALNAKPDAIKTMFDGIAKKRKKAKSVSDVDFVLNNLTEQERFNLRKYGIDETDMINKRKDDEFLQLRQLRYIVIWIDAYDKIKTYQGTKSFDYVAKTFTSEELDVLKRYHGELDKYEDRFFDAANLFDMMTSYLITRETMFLQVGQQAKKSQNNDNLFSINSVD